MEKKVNLLGFSKWMCLPLAFLMFFGTVKSFGTVLSTVMAVVFALSFYTIVENEQIRLIGETIAAEIKKAISETGNVDSMIEIQKLRSGIIARVYLINAKERVGLIHKAITRQLEKSKFKKYLWIMQLTDMPGRSFLNETQQMLNEQLIDELRQQRRDMKKKENKSDK